MHAYSLDAGGRSSSATLTDTADARMTGGMRLLLAVSALLGVVVDPEGLGAVDRTIWPLFFLYALHSLVVYVYLQPGKALAESRWVHWMDVIWYGLIVIYTGAVVSFFFLFFFFAILTSAFRWGVDEGARVTIVSTAIYAGCGLLSTSDEHLPRLLLRATFLLALGYMSVYWGESKLELKRRLALLHEVSRISNPRFGVDQTLATVMEKTREFFRAASCVLVMRDADSGNWTLRAVREHDASRALKATHLGPGAADPMLVFPPEGVVVFKRHIGRTAWAGGASAHVLDGRGGKWAPYDSSACRQLAELFDARSFITAPCPLRNGSARMFVTSSRAKMDKAQAAFLCHLAAQAFPVIENIDLLDRMASEAAVKERQKIARDLHDTAIQPYIGLKLGLSALRSKTTEDNPVLGDLNKLIAMAEKVIGDLRRYAGTVRDGIGQGEPMLLAALRQQTAQVKEFYGIDIALESRGEIHFSDRLTAEVLQLVREGLSNICKHTVASSGWVRLQCTGGWLCVRIGNASSGAVPAFVPHSITERAAALGGRVEVRQEPDGATVVQIDIRV